MGICSQEAGWGLVDGNLPRGNITIKGEFFFFFFFPNFKLYFVLGYGSSEEKAMAPHSSNLAWKIPWTEEPSRLQSMRLLRVGHD